MAALALASSEADDVFEAVAARTCAGRRRPPLTAQDLRDGRDRLLYERARTSTPSSASAGRATRRTSSETRGAAARPSTLARTARDVGGRATAVGR